MLYGFFKTRQPSPGSQAYAFEPAFTLPGFPATGNGFPVNYDFRPLQHPQVYYNKVIPNAGIGGLVAGQIFGQPLLNPDTGTSGQ